MMKTFTKNALFAVVALASISAANAGTTNFYSPSQGYVGSAYTNGGTTNFYSPSQGYVGSAYRN